MKTEQQIIDNIADSQPEISAENQAIDREIERLKKDLDKKMADPKSPVNILAKKWEIEKQK